MAKTYMTNQINNSATIVEVAGAEIAGAHGALVKYDSNGNVVLASVAGEPVVGMAIITNNETIKAGADVDIQVKDIGLVRCGDTAIAKGALVAANAKGMAATAADGNFVIGVALEKAEPGQLFYMQIAKMYKPAAATPGGGSET